MKKTKVTVNEWPFPAETEKVLNKHLRLISRFNNKNGVGARYAVKIENAWFEVSVVKTPDPIKRRRVGSNGKPEYYMHFPSFDAVSIHGAKYTPPELVMSHFYVCRKEELNAGRLRELGIR